MALIDSKQLNPRLTGSFTLSGSLDVEGNVTASGHVTVGNTKNLYLNQGEDTYLDSDSTDRIRFVAGGQQMLVLDYDTGNRAAFGDTKVGIGAGDNHLPNHELEVHGVISSSEYISTDSHITASGNISGSSTSTGSFGYVLADGDVSVNQYITHNGDPDTKINFLDNEIRFEAGNLLLFDIHKKSSTPHEVTVNAGANNVDFIVKDNDNDILFRTDADADNVLFPQALKVSGSSTTTASFGHYQGDGSELTGVAATSLNIDAFGADGTGDTIASDDKFIFSDAGTEKRGNISQIGTGLTSIINSSITKIGTATNEEYITFGTSNEVNTFIGNSEILSVTATGIDVTGNATISGNLTVSGTQTILSTTNLAVKDAFIFTATGSAAANVDGGLIVQSGSAADSGSAIYHDISSQRWSVAKSIATNATAVTPLEHVVTVKSLGDNDAPVAADNEYGVGEIAVNSNGTIWIYS